MKQSEVANAVDQIAQGDLSRYNELYEAFCTNMARYIIGWAGGDNDLAWQPGDAIPDSVHEGTLRWAQSYLVDILDHLMMEDRVDKPGAREGVFAAVARLAGDWGEGLCVVDCVEWEHIE